MKKLLTFSTKLSLLTFSALFPVFVFAQSTAVKTCTANSAIGNLLCKVHVLLNSVIPIIVAAGLVYFVWGVVRYVIAGGEEAKTKGRDQIIYGIIGFAVIAGVYGLVNIVVTTFGLTDNSIAPSVLSLSTSDVVGSTCSLAAKPTFQNSVGYVTCIINNAIIPLIFAVAIAAFLYGVVNYFIIGANEEAKRSQGRDFIIWGLVALVVMLSIWSLVGILGGTFGLNTNFLPQVKPPGATSSVTNPAGGGNPSGGTTGDGGGCTGIGCLGGPGDGPTCSDGSIPDSQGQCGPYY